ncbi:MAG: sigma 54-interacting transcriptional regulator [Thermodesulfobacteriota bacterium]
MRTEPRIPFESKVVFSCQNQAVSGSITNLSLKGIFINAHNCPPKHSFIELALTMPFLPEPPNVMAKVKRTDNGGFAAEFFGMNHDVASSIWSFVCGRLTSLNNCPYCGTPIGDKQSSYCPHCTYLLSFDDPDYFEKRDTAITRKSLMDFIGKLSDPEVHAIARTIRRYLLGRNTEISGNSDEEMVGTCDKMRTVFHLIRKVATADVPVLIIGETGTGKEMTARAIHERSLRQSGPFIPINCGAIPKDLLESELFGYEKGAFTGAERQVRGRIEYAAGGTLFLDEVGELPPPLQVKLLRFLEDYRIERVGGRESIGVDLRIIAATNRDLEKDIAEGRFREDLFYRLNVVTIHMPALRERGEDIVIMAEMFLRKYAQKVGKNIGGFTREALIALKTHHWPGNVRELVNRIRRAAVMAEQRWITPDNLELKMGQNQGEGLKEASKRFEHILIKETLGRHEGKISQTAKALKISRSEMYYLLKKHNIQRAVLSKD